MVNLYQVLGLSYSATSDEIQAALERKQSTLDAKTVKAVTEWLLVDNVRTRYDAKLRQEQPEFFQAATVARETSSTASLQKNETQEVPQTLQSEEEYYVPNLWNPTAAAIWAFFLSPMLGAWLHAINWRELGEEKLAEQNMYFVWGTAASGFLVILIEAVANIEFPPAVSGIAIWAAWFVTVGKKQIEFVHNEVNDDYDKKGWGKPIGLTILGLCAYVAALIAFAFLLVIAGVMQLPA